MNKNKVMQTGNLTHIYYFRKFWQLIRLETCKKKNSI